MPFSPERITLWLRHRTTGHLRFREDERNVHCPSRSSAVSVQPSTHCCFGSYLPADGIRRSVRNEATNPAHASLSDRTGITEILISSRDHDKWMNCGVNSQNRPRWRFYVWLRTFNTQSDRT